MGTAVLAACLALSAGTAHAVRGDVGEAGAFLGPGAEQGPAVPGQNRRDARAWWKDPEMVEAVGLTPDQVTKIDRIYGERQRQMGPKFEQYRAELAELNQLLRERTSRPDEVEAQTRRWTYAYFDVLVSRVKMLYEISLVMTPEQNERFEKLNQGRGGGGGRSQGRGDGRGPGGN